MKWLRISSLAALVAVVALVAFGAVAFAQGPATTPPAPGLGLGLGPRWGGTGGMGGPQNSLVAVTAQVLKMDATDMVAALNGGKTIADLAKEKVVSTDKIVEAFLASRSQALKAAVDAKRITQAQADAALAMMKAHVTEELTTKFTPRGYGMGAGFVDANKDGICDLCGAVRAAGQFAGPRWSR